MQKIAILRNHILVKVLIVVFKNHMFYCHQRMTFEFGVIWGVCKCASSKHAVHIVIFFDNFVISAYVTFTDVRTTCAICVIKNMVFVIDVDKNLAAARRFDGKCLENSREN